MNNVPPTLSLKEKLKRKLRTKEIQRLSKPAQTNLLEKACEKKGIKKEDLEKLLMPRK